MVFAHVFAKTDKTPSQKNNFKLYCSKLKRTLNSVRISNKEMWLQSLYEWCII